GATGEIAMFTGTIGGYGRVLAAVRSAKGEDAMSPFALVPYPGVTKEATNPGLPATGTGYFLIDNGNPDATKGAIEFMHFIAQDEYYTGWLKQTGYMPISAKTLEDENYTTFIDEDRPECWYLINLAGSRPGGTPYPVNTIDTEWKDAWIGCMEKVCADTSYDVTQAVEELNIECQDALDIWLMSNGY
ncbi:MAG: extracellular solute-binding protein, partial [Clostridia bacterium]|nr:extracellular solute-binding protein [Clostridia bacterium]